MKGRIFFEEARIIADTLFRFYGDGTVLKGKNSIFGPWELMGEYNQCMERLRTGTPQRTWILQIILSGWG